MNFRIMSFKLVLEKISDSFKLNSSNFWFNELCHSNLVGKKFIRFFRVFNFYFANYSFNFGKKFIRFFRDLKFYFANYSWKNFIRFFCDLNFYFANYSWKKFYLIFSWSQICEKIKNLLKFSNFSFDLLCNRAKLSQNVTN